jgi:hypothetical protein
MWIYFIFGQAAQPSTASSPSAIEIRQSLRYADEWDRGPPAGYFSSQPSASSWPVRRLPSSILGNAHG